MDLEKDVIYQYIRRIKRGGETILGLCAGMVLSALMFSACTDDLLSPDNGNPADGVQTLKTYDLPGVMGVSLSTQDIENTRSDNTSDGRPFADGTWLEYALSEQKGDEFFHYLVLFKSNDNDSKPVIFPIDTYTSGNNSDRNITLTISKVFADGELDPKGAQDVLSSLSSFTDYFSGHQAYILLNFQLSNDNYICNSALTGSNTVERLSSIKKSDFESLQMKDIRVQGKRTVMTTDPSTGAQVPTETTVNFFTMSNSVYSTGTAKVIDGTSIDTSKIFSNEDDAFANPAIKACVERLASKITVNFNATKMKDVGNFGPSADDCFPIEAVTIESDGLPLIETQVYRVNMIDDGIHFTNEGYEIQKEPVAARIKILGFGVSNLESSVSLYKTIKPSYGTTSWQWTDPTNHRSYWSEDKNYNLTKAQGTGGVFTKIVGYPHQFRRALDSDTVSSYHAGQSGDYDYTKEKVTEGYKIAGETYTSYADVGTINDDAAHRISGVVLNYKSFEELNTDFTTAKLGYSINNSTKTVTFDPLYTMENTYWDEGMLLGTAASWQWPWYRAPHALTTNLMVLAQIEIKGNLVESETVSDTGTADLPSEGRYAKTREGEGEGDDYNARTIYLGQNNIFYLRKVNLLKSKLAILNKVMLSGGNAGIQILRGQWDSHQRGEGDDNLLDKVAWNEGSKLWIAEVATKKGSDGNDLYEDGNLVLEYEQKIGHDADNNEYTYNQVKLEKAWLAYVDNSNGANEDDQDLDLIPAEISGGDGQCLIAPNKKWMGAKYKYYLAPESAESTEENPKMDEDLAVEISYNHLVALIHKIIGPVDVYTNGLMYYNVPIPHRISQYNGRTGASDWAHIGAYSVVRNNWYNISVTEISKLGTPVHVTSQPIVPVMDVKRSYLNMGVELLNWHDIIQDNIPLM